MRGRSASRRHRKSLSSERTFSRISNPGRDGCRDGSAGGAGVDGLSKRQITGLYRYAQGALWRLTPLTRSQTLAGPTADRDSCAILPRLLLRSSQAGDRSVRLLGLGASNLVPGELEQLELFA